jgi:hypothetical protein
MIEQSYGRYIRKDFLGPLIADRSEGRSEAVVEGKTGPLKGVLGKGPNFLANSGGGGGELNPRPKARTGRPVTKNRAFRIGRCPVGPFVFLSYGHRVPSQRKPGPAFVDVHSGGIRLNQDCPTVRAALNRSHRVLGPAQWPTQKVDNSSC